jgi:hypothetical protein
MDPSVLVGAAGSGSAADTIAYLGSALASFTSRRTTPGAARRCRKASNWTVSAAPISLA